MKASLSFFALSLLTASAVFAQGLKCDVTEYKGSAGLTATLTQDLLVVAWTGQEGSELRARYAIDNGQPVVRDLAVRKRGGQWSTLGQNLRPEYHVVSGLRRFSKQQGDTLSKELGVEITQAIKDQYGAYAFHDAPLEVPGTDDGSYDLPRKPEEIRRADSKFSVSGCKVKTDGTSLEVNFPGLEMGIFAGSLQFTVYRGSNLIRMDALAKTDEKNVAYKYDAGLKGFSTDLLPQVVWQDIGGHNQKYEFGAPVNAALVPQKAKNRIMIAEGKGGSVATFPPPHKFFWARQLHKNLGYVWYRKDTDTQYGLGVRQAEHEDSTQTGQLDVFALYNAPPGTVQRMGMYYYVTPGTAEQTRQAILAFTHGDSYKPIPGYKTFTNHWHLSFTDRVKATGSLDTPLSDILALKELGLNLVGLADRARSIANQKDYYEAARRASDKDFLVLPYDELSGIKGAGGHLNLLLSHAVYFTKTRKEGQPFSEDDPGYGKVYHLGSADDLQKMLDAENGYWNTAHPRTKNSAGYPDAYMDKPIAKNDRYMGVDFTQAMGEDLSDPRMNEWRVFDGVDVMNNLYANSGLKPKIFSTDIDTYAHSVYDDLYPNHQTVYLKLDKVPTNGDWNPVLDALRNGYGFSTTGEVLITSYAVEGTGNKRTISADVSWTFPLNFVEVVWGDGKKIETQVISAKDTGAFGSKHFSIPFDATGKTWVRFSVWDSAGDPAFVDPIWLFPKN